MPVELLYPPADVPEIQRGNWLRLPDDDPLTGYIRQEFWDLPAPAAAWETARLSHAVFLYREPNLGWCIAAKFYTIKTGEAAERYAAQEARLTTQAVEALGAAAGFHVPRPLGAWRGVLFLEYMDGITLEDTIAIRRSRPGSLLPALERTAGLLAALHANTLQADVLPEFEPEAEKAVKFVRELSEYGVLQDDPLACEGLERLLGAWAGRPEMLRYTPCLNHGDATPSNFVFPTGSPVKGGEGAAFQLAAIDWERARLSDPAFDLGRLMAEVMHSIHAHGGSPAEALPFARHIAEAYLRAAPDRRKVEDILYRARFYQAASTLRIARNGWISREVRLGMVAQAYSLLGPTTYTPVEYRPVE